MNLTAEVVALTPAVRRIRLFRDGPLSWREVLQALQRDPEARRTLTEVLQTTPFKAYFWECTPLTPEHFDRPWACVLVESVALARSLPDPRPFAAALAGGAAPEVRTFANLGGDALLVSPCAAPGPATSHVHLAAFVRGAAPEQVDTFWEAVAAAVFARCVGRRVPLWVSTSGLGVAWLHVRLDDRPKYVSWEPYRHVG